MIVLESHCIPLGLIYSHRRTDGQDFSAVSRNITIDEDLRRGCLEIAIIDDSVEHEEDEQFMVQFTVLTPGVEVGEPNTSFVTIIDNDGKYVP